MGARTGEPSSTTGKGRLEPVGELADGQALVAGLERPPATVGERLVDEPRERLRRSETARRAADEQNPRQPLRRHGSL